ncbi:hypothetical protein Pan97_11340 [Bremerella volcania]|uniref:Carboxypeptidase regulatory-like domain-containing protein n=1 Tax=Bremerella volcania TaxID=2527984 RepID=A0A518C4H2_9BACT|nr:carboxypeptidase-like regulatory domain-containing protein [Bremerella volcania]QDU74129.1 hypothetical protein Pan97_11340 [Bremerella volcania]
MDQQSRFFLLWLSIVAVLPFTVGCFGSSSNPDIVEVTGLVQYKGSGVEGAQVVFVPLAANASPASATTDSQGNFTLTTYWNATKSQVDGAMPGQYQVTVKKTREPTQEEIDAAMASGKSLQTDNQLPAKFATASKTPLKAEVKDKGENHFELVLED